MTMAQPVGPHRAASPAYSRTFSGAHRTPGESLCLAEEVRRGKKPTHEEARLRPAE